MSLSRLVVDSKLQGWRSRLVPRVSWRTAVIIGIPVGIAGLTFLAYYLKNKKEKNDAELTPETPLEAALALKLKGNKFFKGGQYAQAISLYDEGLKKCPLDAVQERAAFYQNRAAAKENQRQYESAIEDCSLALSLTPNYLKALNRRAHLYEKLKKLDECLLDITACCIFEKFKNADNIVFMDQILKTIGQQKAQEERSNLFHELPSASFIRNYLSAFACNPFTVTSSSSQLSRHNSLTTDNPTTINGVISDEHSVSNTSNTESASNNINSNQYDATQFKEPLQSAFTNLNLALDYMTKGNYNQSSDCALKSVNLFESVLSDKSFEDAKDLLNSPPLPTLNDSNGVTVSKSNSDIISETTTNGHQDEHEGEINITTTTTPLLPSNTNPSSPKKVQTNESIKAYIKEAYNQASLLHATYQALAGRSEEAKERFQNIGAPDSGASLVVRVNALIKSACLSMSVDQDVASCLYDFQRAQSAWSECPDIYLHRGQINLLADQLDEALHDLNTAVKLKPEFSVAQAQRLYTLYRCALNSGDISKVDSRIEEFRRLVKKYPNCLETYSLFAQILSERGDFQESDKIFADLINLSPDSGLAYAHRGLLQLKWKQDRDAALSYFIEGIKKDPKCELIHELLGQLSVEKGQFIDALKHFNLAIKQAKTQNDLAHLIALREGVNAQLIVCEKYKISIPDVVASIQHEQQKFLMAMQEKL
ncbi:Mitochondrial import receptor subunit tom70 [Schistosoma japonicum]|nr:Mitochondrial import receptor subunit tom70 [Schistosoma japonicum]